jgi:hypothetical protein
MTIDQDALYGRSELPAPYNRFSCQVVSRMIRRGHLPRPIKIGARNYWRGADLVAHMQNLPPKKAPKEWAA